MKHVNPENRRKIIQYPDSPMFGNLYAIVGPENWALIDENFNCPVKLKILLVQGKLCFGEISPETASTRRKGNCLLAE